MKKSISPNGNNFFIVFFATVLVVVAIGDVVGCGASDDSCGNKASDDDAGCGGDFASDDDSDLSDGNNGFASDDDGVTDASSLLIQILCLLNALFKPYKFLAVP